MKSLVPVSVLVLALLPGLGACAMDPQVGVDGDQASLTSAETRGVLVVVNTATFTQLDVDVALDVRAATNIVDYRDAQPIQTIAELDGIRYVGPSALDKLMMYAYENGYVDAADTEDCLVISEYIEAWGTYNKAVELFNCGTAPLALSNYSLCLVRNDDATCSRAVVLDGGELAAGAVHTVCRRRSGHPASNDPAAPITANCDQEAAGVMTFSGDDRLLVLERASERVADAFGVPTVRPASATWANTLYRRCNFEPFDGTSFDLARFTTHTSGDMSDFGTAPVETCAGGAAAPLSVTITTLVREAATNGEASVYFGQTVAVARAVVTRTPRRYATGNVMFYVADSAAGDQEQLKVFVDQAAGIDLSFLSLSDEVALRGRFARYGTTYELLMDDPAASAVVPRGALFSGRPRTPGRVR